MSAQAIRGYIRTLRTERGATQAEVADHIKMPLTTYKDWERGITKDIKMPFALRAVKFLRGSLDQVAEMSDETTAADGEAMARAWVQSPLAKAAEEAPADDVERFSRYLTLVASGVAPADAAREVLPEPDH